MGFHPVGDVEKVVTVRWIKWSSRWLLKNDRFHAVFEEQHKHGTPDGLRSHDLHLERVAS